MSVHLEGFVLINKPIGKSSFAMVHELRKVTGIKKVGHCGTLDPFAEGLLILALGRTFTKQINHFQDLEKTYVFTACFGKETNTLDPEGEVTFNDPQSSHSITKESIETLLPTFLGEQQQIPPSFSAKKIDGKRAYKLAREGKEVELKPNIITIFDLELLSFSEGEYPLITCRVRCSKGTYIRSLARDIARQCGSYGYTTALVREKIGEYDVKASLTLENLSQETIKQKRFMLK